MIWRNVEKEIPEKGRDVCVIKDYWKREGYHSVEIMAGTVIKDWARWYVANYDSVGQGTRLMHPVTDVDRKIYDHTFKYWSYCEDMPKLPDELIK